VPIFKDHAFLLERILKTEVVERVESKGKEAILYKYLDET
jgi:hypothetical protein